MIVNVRMGTGQPNRLRVRNEMNFVIAFRHFPPQFGRDFAAAAVGRIARNADFHARPFRIATAGIQILTECFMRGKKRTALERALHVLGGLRVGGHGLDLLLQPFLSCCIEAGELNAHAHSAIRGPDNGWGGNLFGTQPERDG